MLEAEIETVVMGKVYEDLKTSIVLLLPAKRVSAQGERSGLASVGSKERDEMIVQSKSETPRAAKTTLEIELCLGRPRPNNARTENYCPQHHVNAN